MPIEQRLAALAWYQPTRRCERFRRGRHSLRKRGACTRCHFCTESAESLPYCALVRGAMWATGKTARVTSAAANVRGSSFVWFKVLYHRTRNERRFVSIFQQGHQQWRQPWNDLWRGLWEKFAKTRYTQALEAEVARLRVENRAMLNSILGIAGVPPIPAMESEVAAVREAVGAGNAPGGVQSPRQATAGGGPRNTGIQAATPLRRRSWHQINRMLEFQSTTAEPPPGTNGSQRSSKA